jgi:hypothetical protein
MGELGIRRPQYPRRIEIEIDAVHHFSPRGGANREDRVRGTVQVFPNDGEYLFAVSPESGAALTGFGGLVALTSISMPLLMFPAPSAFSKGITIGRGPVATDQPTDQPTDKPTDQPTDKPTDQPTDKPTDQPTDKPTDQPTDKPTDKPTDQPTDKPTDKDSGFGFGDLNPQSIFDQWGNNVLDFGSEGVYSFEQSSFFTDGYAVTRGNLSRTSALNYVAKMRSEVFLPAHRTADLVQLMPFTLVLIPNGERDFRGRSRHHYRRSDGQTISADVQLQVRLGQDGKATRLPLLFTHECSVPLLGRLPVEFHASGNSSSLNPGKQT